MFASEIFAQLPDGRVERVSPVQGSYFQPCVHPEGKAAVFYGGESGVPRLLRVDLTTRALEALTPPRWSARHPVYSWDGSLLAFASDGGASPGAERIERMSAQGFPPAHLTSNLFVMHTDGHGLRRITHGPCQDQRPCFSPDGETLVFVSNRSGAMRLWSVPVRGHGEPRMLQQRGWGYRPWFSVDGEEIFFFSGTRDRHQVWRMPRGGGEAVPLENDDRGLTHGPFADPGGEHLLVHSNRDGAYRLYELPLDGSPMRLCQPPGFGVAAHATRARNGVVVFDAPRRPVLARYERRSRLAVALSATVVRAATAARRH